MKRFSQYYGNPDSQRAFHSERANDTLRFTLWSALSLSMWSHWKRFVAGRGFTPESERINAITRRLWLSHLKLDIDTLPDFKQDQKGRDAYDILKDYFFACDLTQLYAFIEFLVQDRDTFLDEEVIPWLNRIFEEENSAARIVGNRVVMIPDARKKEFGFHSPTCSA